MEKKLRRKTVKKIDKAGRIMPEYNEKKLRAGKKRKLRVYEIAK